MRRTFFNGFMNVLMTVLMISACGVIAAAAVVSRIAERRHLRKLNRVSRWRRYEY